MLKRYCTYSYVMLATSSSRVNPVIVLSMAIVLTCSPVLIIVISYQEADAVSWQHSEQTVCIDGECKTTEIIIGDCPQSQCKSDNTNTTK